MSHTKRGMRPKWIKGRSIPNNDPSKTLAPMNFNKRNARKPRPKGQPGRGH